MVLEIELDILGALLDHFQNLFKKHVSTTSTSIDEAIVAGTGCFPLEGYVSWVDAEFLDGLAMIGMEYRQSIP